MQEQDMPDALHDNLSQTKSDSPMNYVLNVSNLPKDIKKDGITSMFNEYGNITNLIHYKNRCQASISFSTYQAAERAIHDLHNKPPLKLNIQFPTKHLKDIQATPLNLSGPLYDHRYKEYDEEYCNSMKKSIKMGKPNFTPDFRPSNYSTDDDLLYPYPSPHDFATFNPYDNVGPYYDTNLMYTRGLTHISRDGRRHVAFGRGYTFYRLPEPQYDIGACLQTVHEKRERGLYEFVSDDLDDESGVCQICSTPTAFRCQKCDITFYCSRNCQRSDWPKHKLDCQRMPPLVKKVINSDSSYSNGLPKSLPQRNLRGSIGNSEHDSVPVQQNKLSNGAPCSPSGSVNNYNTHQHNDNLRNEAQKPNAVFEKADTKTSYKPSPPRDPKSGSPQNQYQQQQKGSTQSQHQQQRHGVQQQQQLHQTQEHQPSRPQQQKQCQRTPQQQRSSQNKQSRPQQQQQHTSSKSSLASRMSDEDIVFDKTDQFLPRDEFVDVTIMNCVGHFEYFVQRNDRISDLEAFKEILAEAAKRSQYIEPKDNLDCVIEYDGTWYRGVIMSVEKSEVFFYDYGIFDTVEVKRVFRKSFNDYPYFARRIRIADTTNSAFKELAPRTSLSVKLVSVTGDATIVVEAKNCSELAPSIEEQSMPTEVKPVQAEVKKPVQRNVKKSEEEDMLCSKLNSLPNVFNELKPSMEVCVIIHSEISKNEFNLTLVTDELLFQCLVNELADTCLSLTKVNNNFRPNVGDYVCGAAADDEWYRGIVSSVQPDIKLAVVDECRFFTPIKCSPMPNHYQKIVTMGLICKLAPDAEWPKDTNGAFIEVVDVSKDFATVKVKPHENSAEFIGQLRKWTPKPEQKSVMNPQLVSGNNVMVLFVTNCSDFYVKIDEPEEKERIHKLEQEVAACARNRKPLLQKPVVGEMVLSYYETDENYYRAIVTKAENDKFMVKYLDYGNVEVKTMKHLYQLSDSLKTERASCIKVALKGIEKDIPLTPAATDYFLSLIAEEASLQCTFTGNPVTDGVVLKTQKNEVINDVLKSLLEPTYKKTNPADDRKVYTIADLPPSMLGNVGDEITAIPLIYYHESGNITLAPNDQSAIIAIQSEMTDKIQEYVQTTESHYIPRNEELCIALFDGLYYRGLTLESTVDPTHSQILFIDYGNLEKIHHKDIREITPDFLKLPSLGTICNLIPSMFSQKLSEEANKRVKDLVNETINETITVKIISVEDSTGLLGIDIPFIRVKLTEENLI